MKTFSKILAFAATCAASTLALANDGIFPPLPAAKSAIDFDGRGFLIGGKRTFIASGTIHYPRVPRALWRDRLMRLKRGGFNCVETYAFWNYHEEQEGKFDFTRQKDFGAFLQTAQDVGLYVIVRPGPYVCAEWQSGGYPEWLRFKPGVRVREDNPGFESAVDRWYEQVMPIIARHQISRGGSVVMVQLENEHPRGWGTEMPTPYFTHLLAKARAEGIEVPTFFSGLNHGADPAPRQPISSAGRLNPWFTTEFWPGWYDFYGPLPLTGNRSLRQFERGTWRILSNGGNGYNFYMLHGGTNFGTWNSNEDASSYDYGGAIGQTGDLRPIYYRFKRANLFAKSFESILENSDNASADYQNFATGATVTARKSPAGTLVFLDNPGNSAASAKLQSGEEMTLDAGETVGLVSDFALDDTFRISQSAARILGFARQGNTTTLVLYGNPGETGRVRFALPAGVAARAGGTAFQVGAGTATLDISFADGAPQEQVLSIGKKRLRVLAMSKAMADRTFFVESKGASYIVCGASYLENFAVNSGRASLSVEEPLENPGAPTILIYGEQPKAQRLTPPKMTSQTAPIAPVLTAWQSAHADAEAAPNYSDAKWLSSPAPLPMGADGDAGAYAWYRSVIHAPAAGEYSLNFSDVGDWALAYVNGQPVCSSRVRQRDRAAVRVNFPVQLQAGDNALAVLTTHYGRDKLFNYIGPINEVDRKGISGAVSFAPGSTAPANTLTSWRFQADTQGAVDAARTQIAAFDTAGAGWQNAATGQNIFGNQGGFGWFVADLGALSGPNRTVHFEDVDDNATVFLNGQRVGQHTGYGSAFDVSLDAAWREGEPNTLAVLVENGSGAGGIMGETELRSGAASTGTEVQGWKMRGGVTNNLSRWQSLAPVATGAATPVPLFYRASFAAPTSLNVNPILRVSLSGLGRGFVWLNGHNLGRYPEKVPVDGLYLPESWMKPGANEVMILDETGASPSQVKLRVEAAASRQLIRYGR